MFQTLEMLEPGTRAIKFRNKGSLEVAGVGTVELRCKTPSGERTNLLREVAYVPGVAENLFSVRKATMVGAEVVFKGEICQAFMGTEVLLRAEETADGIFVVCQPRATGEETCLLVKEAESPELWHRRLGHAGYESLAKMVEGGLVRGVEVKAEAFRERKTAVCEPCILGSKPESPSPRGRTPRGARSPLSSCTWTCAGLCR